MHLNAKLMYVAYTVRSIIATLQNVVNKFSGKNCNFIVLKIYQYFSYTYTVY